MADALVNAEQGAASDAEVERQRDAAQDELLIASRRYEARYSGYLEVLDAQRTAQDAELALVRSRQARLDAGLRVMKAVDGVGWSVPQHLVECPAGTCRTDDSFRQLCRLLNDLVCSCRSVQEHICVALVMSHRSHFQLSDKHHWNSIMELPFW